MYQVAVIIICRNEVKYIEECIYAILKCEKTNFEISINIVDGMSDDGTRDLIYQLITKHPEVKLIDNEKKLTPYAFNLGIINNPKADFYQIIGARHIISENYIDNSLQKIIENNDIWCIGGKIINEYTNLDSQIISYAMGTKLGMGIGNFRTLTKSTYTDTVTSPLYPKWVFDKIGYFDEALVRNQDDDFNYRVTKAGGKIYFNAETSLRYYVSCLPISAYFCKCKSTKRF